MGRSMHRELLEIVDKCITIGRRKSQRFPIELHVRYRTLGRQLEGLAGTGKTINISSSGVLFTSQHQLPMGTRVQVCMCWPVKLNEKCGLNLVGTGRVVRHAKGKLALRVQEWQFRTTTTTQGVAANRIWSLRG